MFYLLGLVVLELNVQTVLDTDFHLDRVIDIGWHSIRIDPYIPFIQNICQTSGDGDSDEISKAVMR